MRELDRGEEFIVTRNGVPVGELRPVRPRRFVPRETVLAAFANAPRVDYEQLRADIDAVVDQDPTPRVWREP
jgi:antitoxin (DNA-binding transcriptional repressor) of toxin-antitoxin stability system